VANIFLTKFVFELNINRIASLTGSKMSNAADMHNLMSLHNAMMYSCRDIISIKDLNLRYVTVNKAFLDAFKIDEESKIIGMQSDKILTTLNLRILKQKYAEIIKNPEIKSFVLNLENECNSKFARVTCYPIIKEGVLTGILSVTRDETEGEKFKLKLIEKICVINSLLENMPMLAFMKDCNNNYITGSKYAKKFFQEGIDAYTGSININMNDALNIIEYEDDYVKNEKAAVIKEKSCKSKDGHEHWYKIYKAPIFDADNEINGIVSIAQNIDIEKQLELQKELFLATLTHDLKTPLQAQISSLELLSKGTFGKVNESQREILAMILESADFMKEMLYSILSVYKYENGMVKLDKEFFDIDKLIQICIKEASHLAEEKNIKIEYNNCTKDKMVYADVSQIRRVIANMLNNAINYAYKNTKIFVTFSDDNDSFIVKIGNTSAPIPPNIGNHIFDKYVSGSDIGKRRGIGLGLYFCKMVMDAHNGKILLNANDTNNEFVIELPKNRFGADTDVLKFI